MPIKTYQPTTPARRGTSVVVAPDGRPPKRLASGRAHTAGRTRAGITARHRGGAAKRKFREIDFVQDKTVSAEIEHLAYDPYRSCFIALLRYADGGRRYVLAEASQQAGQTVAVGPQAAIRKGNRVPLGRVPTGTTVFNVQLRQHAAGSIVRAAGSSATVTAQESSGHTQVKLPSGEVRRIPADCLATIGVASNPDHGNVRIGKAGRNRNRGHRPHVRGKAMNPVDHPHGGGEGGSPIGLKGPKTPSGLYTLGRKTRRVGKRRTNIVRSR